MAKPRKTGTTRSTRAKAGTSQTSSAAKDTPVEDAEVVEEIAADGASEGKSGSDDAEKVKAADATEDKGVGGSDEDTPDKSEAEPAPADETPPNVADADDPKDAAGEDPSQPEVVTPKPEPASEASSFVSSLQPVAPVSPPPQRSGLGGMIFGGVIAAVLGALALFFASSQGWIALGQDPELQATVEAQAVEIGTLRSELDAAEAEIEALAGTGAAIDAVGARIDGVSEVANGASEAVVTLAGQLEATNERLDTVATEPIPEARLPEQVTNAYEAKFAEFSAALQKEQDAKLAEIEARLSATLIEMEELQGAAEAAEQAAMDAAEAAKLRTALAEIEVALDTGAAYPDALETLAGADVPAALADGADGSIATLGQLQASFPEAARAALVASTRAAADDGSVGGLTAFFRTQLGARSLEPREGDDPDAVLSRAEAAVNSGDLQAALAEFDALPEPGQAALADWKASAEARIEATSALATLSDQLNSN